MFITVPDARGGVGGQQIRLHRVRNEGEVAGLLSVAVDPRRLTLEAGRHELGNHRGVLALRVLSRPVHVEVAQRDGLEAVEAGVEAAVGLSHVLLERVGRHRVWRHRLHLGKRRRVTVGRRGGGEDQPANPRLSRGFQQAERPRDVHVVGSLGLGDTARHGGQCRLVEDHLDVADAAGDQLRVAQVAAQELDPIPALDEILLATR